MRTITLDEMETNPVLEQEICDILEDGGLVCLPCGGSYRIIADLQNASAVMRLIQSKRRIRRTPSLVFVENELMLETVALEVTPATKKLASRFWPGPLTILFDTHASLPKKITKQITAKNGKIGVRVPQQGLAKSILRRFGKPLLVSSANRERKPGEGSVAQVRRNFSSGIDLFVDAGDIKKEESSTVVTVDDSGYSVIRPGAITHEQLDEVLV